MAWLKIRYAFYLFLFAESLLTSKDLISGPAYPASAILKGSVTDARTTEPLTGAKISVNGKLTYSIGTGRYYLTVDPVGTYPVNFTKTGFDPVTTPPVTFHDGSMTDINVQLQETANPSPSILASLLSLENMVKLTWERPVGNYELLYDDGVEDNFTVWARSGNMNALKFSPLAWPVNITGGSVNIGRESDYPAGSNPLKPFQIQIMDASGPGGSPGNVLAGPVDVTPSGFGWVDFTLPASYTLAAGDFFIVMIQGGNAPDAAGLAVDLTVPGFRSYSKYVSGNGNWLPAGGNFMIRALLTGPGGPPSGQGTPRTVSYQLWRLHQGEESNPQAWNFIDSVYTRQVLDSSWNSLPCGPYRWAVVVCYPGHRLSTPAISNVIGKCWTAPVTVNLALSCSGSDPKGTVVQLRNQVYPDTLYTGSFDSTGRVIFPLVWKGSYTITAKKFGYQDYQSSLNVAGETTVNVVLLQRKSPPTNLEIDSQSLYSKWDVPFYNQTLMQENWSGGSFASAGWTVGGGVNWRISTSYGNPLPSASFNWSPRVFNYDQSITSPPVTGQNSPILTLKYDISLLSFSSSAFETMDVQISDGSAWQTLKTWSNAGGDIVWTSDELDISAYTNKTFRIRFRSSGADSYQVNSWYIDNILVYASESAHLLAPCIYGYTFYLNNALLATVSENNYTIPGTAVKYDSTYTACVAAIYTSGYSGRECRQFTSHFLWPPRELAGTALESTASLQWKKPGYYINGSLISPPGLTGYNIYKNNLLLVNITGADVLAYNDPGLDPGSYSYTVSAVYDLTPYGHPGQEGYSGNAGPVSVQIRYGLPLPFSEPWDQGSFSYHTWTFPGGQGNWKISQLAGNPPPCSAFPGMPAQTAYNFILESPALDATIYSCASIWLDFDLKLEDANASGTEKLILDVSYNGAWHQKAEYVNSGSTTWLHSHIDISAVKQKGFKFRFRASGSNSSNILNWYLDNIAVYPVCLPARNLGGEAFGMDTHLSWSPPRCNGGGMLLQEGFEEQDFPPPYWDRIIHNVSATWAHTGISSPVGVHSGNFSAGLSWDYNLQNEWIIARNVFVNGNLQFWSMAYQGSAHGDHYYVKVSTDQGQSWVKLLDMSAMPPFPGPGGYNHWQQPYVVDMSSFLGDVVDIAWNAVDTNGQGLWYYWAIDDCSMGGKKLGFIQDQPYYNVYRNDGPGNDFFKVNTQPVPDTLYTDSNPGEGWHKYYIQVVNPVCSDALPSDTVLIDVVTSVRETDGNGNVKVFPNPAHDWIRIIANAPVDHIIMSDMLGNIILDTPINGVTETKINLPPLATSLYFLKVFSGKLGYTARVSVIR